MCKASRDLMDDSREDGIETAKLEAARNLLGLLPDEVLADRIGLPLVVVEEMHKEATSYRLQY